MLYEITVFGTFFNQQSINRYNYLSVGEPAAVLGSFALMTAFGAVGNAGVYPVGSPFRTLLNMVSVDYKVNTVVCRAASLFAPTDFYERPFVTPAAGIGAGIPASPTSAFGFRTNRVRLDVGRGTKRYTGVTEDDTGNGGVFVVNSLNNMALHAVALTDTLAYTDEGNNLSFSPCIVSKEEYTTPAGKKAYRYYPTLLEQLDHVATGIVWQAYPQVRTQVSRQYGRGI